MANNAAVAAALAKQQDWRHAYPFVEAKAREILDTFGPESTLTTTELADRIYSPDEAHDPKVRKRVFQALSACATRGLAPYVTLTEPMAIGAGLGTGRRKTWHAPKVPSTAVRTCPTCLRPL